MGKNRPPFRCAVRAARLLVLSLCVASPVRGDKIDVKLWDTLYRELNAGEDPHWTSKHGLQVWALRERARLTPIVLQGLRGEREGTEWAEYLPVAATIPSPPICDVLFGRLEEIIARHPSGPIEPQSADEANVGRVLDILAQARDVRVRDVAAALVAKENQAFGVVEHGVRALQKVGDASSLDALARVPRRQGDAWVDRLCSLTESMIKARARGEDILSQSQSQLTALVDAYVSAFEDRDYEGYAELMPFGFRDRSSEAEVHEEVFENAEAAQIFAELKKSRQSPFDVDRDELHATLVFDGGRHQLECVLEVDGWKVLSVVRIAD